MKMALVGPVYPYRGGIAHYTAMLYRELVAQGHHVSLFSFKRQYPRWLFPGRSDRDPSRLKLEATCSYTLDSLNPLTWLATARAIRAQRPDVLVLQWWVPFFAPMWLTLTWCVHRAGIKVIFICHNVLPHEQYPWDAWLARWTLRQGDGFIVQSQDEKAQLLTLVPGRPLEVVSHPVHDMFAAQAIPRARAREQLGLPAGAPVLLFFGFVREYKGLHYLLEAMPAIRAQLPDVHLLIAGEFWQDKQAYLDQIARLGLEPNITVIDRYIPNEEVAVYFSAADVVVLPYVHVTQSSIVQLAFGFGVPVITTRVGGLPEVVREGETGLVVPSNDPEAMAEAICHYFRDNLQSVMKSYIFSMYYQFAWEHLVRALEQLIATKVAVNVYD